MEPITLQQKDIILTKETATSKILFTKNRIYKVKKMLLLFPLLIIQQKRNDIQKLLKNLQKVRNFLLKFIFAKTY